MNVALDNSGKRIFADDADKSNEYFCPICKEKVILKQGDLNAYHYSHYSKECSDYWNYQMNEWSMSMQSRFPEEQREVVVEFNGEKHIADVLCGNQIIEFIYSPITFSELAERNEFYNAAGFNVAWVFNVQEQYDLGTITIMDRDDDVLMYKWSNPRRYIQSLPQPKEYNKKIVPYFYWINEDDYEDFNKVIWSTNEDGCPNFKRFIISSYCHVLSGADVEDFESPLSVKDFFITKDDRLKEAMSRIKSNYEIKYSGIKGKPQQSYICPKTNNFGIKLSGENGCLYCLNCGLVEDLSNGTKVYCCYPDIVNEKIESHPGYDCSAPRIS